MATKNNNKAFFKKPLFRSKKDRVVFGLIGGLAEYFEINSALLRLIYIVITTFSGFAPGIVVYVIGSLVVPEKPSR